MRSQSVQIANLIIAVFTQRSSQQLGKECTNGTSTCNSQSGWYAVEDLVI